MACLISSTMFSISARMAARYPALHGFESARTIGRVRRHVKGGGLALLLNIRLTSSRYSFAMWMGGRWIYRERIARRVLFGALLVLVAPATIAEASTRACRQLESQLASLPSGGARASGAQVQRYDAAIARQQQQMQKARDQSRQAGCGHAISGRAVAFCGNLNATMQRMNSNLAELQRQRGRLGGGGDSRRERARIQAALDNNGCRAQPRQEPAPIEARSRQQEQRASSPQSVIDSRNSVRIGGLSGNFRTMCVRTCDGYYFPVSSAARQSDFQRDQNVCQAMCPGTQVELHYHRLQSQESEDMVSAISGLPYRRMTNAFAYRRQNGSSPAGCGCGVQAGAAGARGFEVIGGDYERRDTVAETAAEEQTAAEATESPEPGRRTALPLRRTMDDILPSANTGVRVVGPQFLPDPEEAIDLRVQGPVRGP